ncbi:MAG TPA: tetratricopeptide repeat protein [Dermatophilaceae bacterium]
MKPNPRTASASDVRLSRLLRLGVAVLVIGVLAFAAIYYQDQHVDAGPSLTGRQIAGAEAAVKKTPNNIEVRLQLAAAYLQDKRPSDALIQYDEILKADKGNRPALLGRGRILLNKGDFTAASVTYHKVTDVAAKGEFAGADPQAQEARYYLGSIAIKQGKPKVAITELQHALTINPTDSDALYLLGVAQLKQGSPKLAVNALKKALLFVPTGWCEPYSQLALAYGKLDLAPQKTYATGMASFCLKQPAEAKAQLKTLLKGPVAVDALLGLGLIAQEESKNTEAVSWYQEVLTLDPKNATATSALSRLGAGPTSPPPAAKGSSTTQGPS